MLFMIFIVIIISQVALAGNIEKRDAEDGAVEITTESLLAIGQNIFNKYVNEENLKVRLIANFLSFYQKIIFPIPGVPAKGFGG